MAKKFQEYEAPTETISPMDLMVIRSIDPIFLPVFRDGIPLFVHFYALEWRGWWSREDRGLGHGTSTRAWEFRCQAQQAVGGTIDKLQWGPWAEAKVSFVEGRPGVLFQMKE
ncbi:MAG: hypothetical protein A2605_03310 [Candidatus Zambryskibacteria bacterium RIFOXYD1_FULL_39_35]|nr:MAG: hypothetical protein A2605_03310 [Candidatus Zambryskibacteria bacterium RIFOXYD1_FULL_39_35]